MRFPDKGNRGPQKQGRRQPRFPREITTLYEDQAVIAVNKPAGLPAVPIPGSKTASAWSVVAQALQSRRERLFVVHRIDRFSSGILLFAKTDRDRDALVRQFLEHTPVRQYLAVVRGNLSEREATLVHYFRRTGMFQRPTTEKDPLGARAELKYSVERPLRAASLVRATLVTGLQNQIRVQFAAIGHPVFGDRKYSPAEAAEKRIGRVALHAAHLEFVHPRSGQKISVDCEVPADFRALVDGLGRGRPGR